MNKKIILMLGLIAFIPMNLYSDFNIYSLFSSLFLNLACKKEITQCFDMLEEEINNDNSNKNGYFVTNFNIEIEHSGLNFVINGEKIEPSNNIETIGTLQDIKKDIIKNIDSGEFFDCKSSIIYNNNQDIYYKSIYSLKKLHQADPSIETTHTKYFIRRADQSIPKTTINIYK